MIFHAGAATAQLNRTRSQAGSGFRRVRCLTCATHDTPHAIPGSAKLAISVQDTGIRWAFHFGNKGDTGVTCGCQSRDLDKPERRLCATTFGGSYHPSLRRTSSFPLGLNVLTTPLRLVKATGCGLWRRVCGVYVGMGSRKYIELLRLFGRIPKVSRHLDVTPFCCPVSVSLVLITSFYIAAPFEDNPESQEGALLRTHLMFTQI